MTELLSTPQAPALQKEKDGKTFADVLDSILTHPKKFISALGMFIVIISLIVGAVIGGVALLNKFFGLSFSKVEINTFGNQITLRTTSGKKQSTLVMVHPQGWEDTSIKVRKGELVSFNAEGKVSIDGYSLVKAYRLLGQLEDHYKRQLQIGSAVTDDKRDTPEQHYSERLRDILTACLNRLWTDPGGFRSEVEPKKIIGDCPDFSQLKGPNKDGYDQHTDKSDSYYDYPDQDFPGRTKLKVMPGEPYGELIGAVRIEENGKLRTLDTFRIGSMRTNYPINQDGELWLIVNDVLDAKDKEESKYFYYDNVGFFIVNIQTENN
jgi:hypothetical protein